MDVLLAPPVPVSPLRKLRLPVVFAALFGVAYGAAHLFVPVGEVASPLVFRWLLAVALAAAGVAAVRAVRFFVVDVAFLRTQGHRAPALVHVVVALAMYFALGLLIAGGVFGQSLTGAIATSAVATVVLGLALQETLGNLFAGIALQVERPFRFGDFIRLDGLEGRVEAFNWRATTVVTTGDSRIVIPNGLVARGAVEVFARSLYNRRRLVVSAAYEVPPERVTRVLRDAIEGVAWVAERPAPEVRVGGFGESSVDYDVLYWVQDYLRVESVDAEIRTRVWYAFSREGIAMPFPHQVQVPYEPPVEVGGAAVEERARWLDEADILAPLSSEERCRLAERSRTVLYGPGETLLRAGAPGGSMFVVGRGQVEVLVPGPAGERVRVAEVGPGEVIGEMSLLTGEARSADARAVGEVAAVEVRRAEMKGVLDRNEALAAALACEVSGRLEHRADVVARTVAGSAGPATSQSVLDRIFRFFDLNGQGAR